MEKRTAEAITTPAKTPLIPEFHYRAEIDGLRAIAVMAVVLFHADIGVSGGFVGVDVFFVISGFLITSLILKDLESQKFNFVNFWERRARRIMPAAVVMVLTVLAAGWWLLLPADYVHLAKSTIWQAVFCANIFFWRNTNYFAPSAEELPLLHMWSLAVEEQFYLLFPALLFCLFQCRTFRRRLPLLTVFTSAFILSLFLSGVVVSRSPASAFYLLPTRAWELLCGSIVAVAPPLAALVPRWLRETLAMTGLGCILVPCFLYTKQTVFPGLAALPPCLGTGLVITVCNVPARLGPPHCFPRPAVAQLLAMRPLVFTGLISYSLYLWHWPIFAFSTYWALEAISFKFRVAMVTGGFLLATLSYLFVETPFRDRRFCNSPNSMFIYAGGGLAAMVLAALVIYSGGGFQFRFSKTVLAIDSTKAEALPRNRITQPVSLEDALEKRFPRLGDVSPFSVQLFVWGDSHARSILPAVDQLGRERSCGVLAAWHTSTPPVLEYVPDRRFQGFSLGADCPAYNAAVLKYIATQGIPAVLLAARWSMYFESESDSTQEVEKSAFAKMLVETIRQIRSIGSAPWILMEVPGHRTNVPKALVFRELFGGDVRRFAATPGSVLSQNRQMSKLVPILQEAGARIVDLSSLLEDSKRTSCCMEHDRQALYYDDNHLSKYGALLVREAFAPIFESE